LPGRFSCSLLDQTFLQLDTAAQRESSGAILTAMRRIKWVACHIY
jgi:hypothetical protein